jgi:SRSO17 transposase
MTASQDAKGLLLQQRRGNMSACANNVPGARARRFQYFISESPWEYRPISAQIQCDVLAHIGDVRNEAIRIDETGFPKQDRDSAGVKCQYSGRLGKVDNCQAAVCLGYTNGSQRTLIDAALNIPEIWAKDPYPGKKCSIHFEDLKFKTEAEITFELILRTIPNRVQFGWVGMDAFYERQTSLLNAIDSAGIVYIADILSDSNSVQIETVPGIQTEEFNE